MKSRSQTRYGVFPVPVLLVVLAVAVGAQAALAATPQAGTDGRGGASLTVAVTPQAGTEGRGGVAAIEVATLAGERAVAESGFVSRARGGFPGGPTGVERTLAVSSPSAGWIAAGILAAAVALTARFFAWAAGRRSAWQQQSSLASYCAYHPGDSLCRAT